MARLAVVYVRVLYRLYRNQGTKGVVIATKSWYVLTMQAVGGMVIPATQLLGCAVARSSDGLPRVIPRQSRQRIREGDIAHLKIWLSWFSIYRVLMIPGKLKLSTITSPGVSLSPSLLKEVQRGIPGFMGSLGLVAGNGYSLLPTPDFTVLSKTSPSIKSSVAVSGSVPGVIYGALGLLKSPVITSFRYIAERLPPMEKDFYDIGVHKTFSSIFELVASGLSPNSPRPAIGKLGFKVEAAGKVRVFAMVECWTQWLLRPLHLAIFKILEALPSDGTMDQMAPIDRLVKIGVTKF